MHYISQYGNVYELDFYKFRYAYNDALCIEAWCCESGNEYWEVYGNVTVNLDAPAMDGCSWVDTNNLRHLIDRLHDIGAFEYTGRMQMSGYCAYPEVRWDPEWMAENVKEMEEG